MKRIFVIVGFVLTGCTSTQSLTPATSSASYSDTMEIIRCAAISAPNGVEGEYVLKIKAAANKGTFVFLNTEFDYRDQRSVTVAIHPHVVPLLEEKYGSQAAKYFIDKSISVSGQAKRMKITFESWGIPTDKYYYQTHITVMDVTQITVLNENKLQGIDRALCKQRNNNSVLKHNTNS